jgi:multidrug efflux pump subunit AcrA (membrane-fusion protein)
MSVTSFTPLAEPRLESDPPRLPRRIPGPRPRTRRSRRLIWSLVLFAGACLAGGWFWSRSHAAHPWSNVETEAARIADMPQQISVRGELEPSEATDLFCRVKGLSNSQFATTIRWVAEQGTWVKRGDVVILLDDSGFQEELANRRTPLEQARSDWLQAVQNHKIVVSQNQSDIATAELALKIAELDLKKYVEADHEQVRDDILGRLKLAESDVQMAHERVSYAERMARKGFLSESQLRGERARAEALELNSQRIKEELHTLDQYGHRLNVADLEGKLSLARRAVQLAREQARAKEIQADVDRLGKQKIYQKLLNRYHEIEAEAAKCRLVAPHDGMVIYHMSEQTRSGNGGYQAVIAEGEPVRTGQKLVRIAHLRHMVVRTWVHEAFIGHVHGEADVPSHSRFQKALIRLDAYPDRVFGGHVQRVGAVPWMINGRMDGTLAFETIISLDEPVDGLHPDMNARVTILMDDDAPKNVLTVPVDAILPGIGNHRKLYVMNEEGPEERNVVVGMCNDDMAQIVSGLEPGEEVVVNPDELKDEGERSAPKHRHTH